MLTGIDAKIRYACIRVVTLACRAHGGTVSSRKGDTMPKRLSRRDVTRAVPILMMGSALGGVARFLAACSSDSSSSLKSPGSTEPERATPTDGDEYVPGQTPPVDTGEQPPTVPNPVWEARARQLEDDQKRIYGNVFTNNSATNGVMAGKERSHVPSAVAAAEGNLKRVTVTVQHVMGANGLDAGAYDGGDAGKDGGDAAADAGADARADADASVDAGASDAAKPPVHYITTVYLRAEVNGQDTVVGLWEFQSTDPAPPSVKFTLPAGVTTVTAFEWCTLHGLWKSDPIPA